VSGRRPPRPLYGGRPLADWTRAGGRPERRVAAHALRLAWHAYWFEQNWRTASRRLDALPPPDDPVFVLGFWRSGTTVLHELIAAATDWLTPRTWQCFHPSTCFLSGPPRQQAAAERPMDAGRIETFGPQEDELALLLLGEPSAYRGFIDPRRLDECAELATTAVAAAPAATAPATTLPRWQAFLRGIAAASPGSRLLLKSPGHTFRLPLLQSLFPRARFVWIGRESGEVLASNLRMWRAMMDTYALWDPPGGALERFLSRMFHACGGALERCLAEMPPQRLLWVDFAALTAQPRQTLADVLRFLQLDGPREPAQLERRLTRALMRVPVHPGSRASPPDDEHALAFDRLATVARQRFGPRSAG